MLIALIYSEHHGHCHILIPDRADYRPLSRMFLERLPRIGGGILLGLDEERRELVGSAGVVHLTRSEAALVRELLCHRGRSASYLRLVRAVWKTGEVDAYLLRALRTHVSMLRGKIVKVSPESELRNRAGIG